MRIKLLIALLIIILGGGGGAGWYFFLRDPSPEVVLQKMQAAMLGVRSLHSETAFAAEIDLSELALEDSDKSLALFFPNEREITLNVLVTGDHALDAEGLPMASRATVALYTSPASLARLEAELRTIKKTTYFKLNDIGSFLPFDVSGVQGAWYRADDLEKLAALEDQREEITGEPQENRWENIVKEIRAASTGAMLFDVLETLPEEKLDDVPTRHYHVKLNIPATRAYVERIFEIVNYSSTEEGRAALDRVMKEAENARGELWIGKRDSLLYRTTIAWPFHYALPEDEGSADIAVSLTMKNSKFNEPVTVTAPPDAHDQQEFMQKLLGGFLGGLTRGLPASGDRELDAISSFTFGAEGLGMEASDGQDALGTTDQDQDGLTGTQEKFWGSNPQNPDTDGDGFLDGAEVDNGYSPIGPGRLF